MIVYDIFQLSRAFEHELSGIIIDYHQLSSSLGKFKFDMIVDDNFCGLNKRVTVNNDFRSAVCPSLPKTG